MAKITVEQLIAAMESKLDQDRMAARAFLDSLSMDQIGEFADSLGNVTACLPPHATQQHRAWTHAVESFAKMGLASAVIERLERTKEAFGRKDY